VLFFVFGNLDFWTRITWGKHELSFVPPSSRETTNWTLEVFGLTIVFWLIGYLAERWRKT
jgi:hypothetical protein